MARMWHDKDVSLDPIKGETIAVIGYGIQGAAQASNLRDSGLKVLVGLREGGKSWAKAKSEGHNVMTVADAVKKADVVHILVPDMEQARIYREEIKPNFQKGAALSFSHGAAIHWKWIVAPKQSDVIMVAPKSPGQRVRELYLENFGTPSLVAVQQDYSKKAWERILGMAKGIGSTRPGVLQTTFKEEVESDWFGEQVDLCGGVESMVKNAFETLVEAGYPPEISYFETLHELKLIVDLVQKYGISGMYRRVSETARYGGLTRGKRAIDANVKKNMKKVLKEIQDGTFEKEWVDAYSKEGQKAFQKYMDELEAHQIEKVGIKMRKMMWPNDSVT
ncbi:MAG: ketol-acid reductoisomerase [Thaumarchaeota archaeon]|nr:ketol-acid reductoisomerase [Nitrososphaerota archaeon]